ncbi:MAG: RagB/SusD family nutrient uptake outer membrane protein [Prevotella sp.]|nr:RagB/SusD family nutrient uptake outer membrane protein [Prevotella sp.]MDD4533021.1 RagB/SusD family nutrient uptake outer membrane protein [Prevotella sp.]
MKRNKTFYHIIASVCLMMGMSSCSDFLQVEPQNEIILEKFWNEKADVDGIIFGCYSAMQSDNILMRMMVWGEFRSDNISRGLNLNRDNSLESVLKENLTASNAYTTWDQFYDIINRCNTLIKYAPQVAEKDPSFSLSELKADIAEVSALRDLCYFYLIRTFRDVPYTTVAFTDDNQVMDLPATSFDNVLDSLITNLESVKDEAVKAYPSGTSTQELYQTSRITQEAIHAMLCEMYLWKQDYQKCIQYADLVINAKKLQAEEKQKTSTTVSDYSKFGGYPLISESSYGSLTTFGNAYTQIFGEGNSSESILELTFMPDDNMPSNGAVNLCYGFGIGGVPTMGYGAPSTYVSDVTTTANNGLNDVFMKYDSRYYENILAKTSIGKYLYTRSSIDFSSTNPNLYYGGVYSEKRNKSNWIIYRLTDIMLMKAEAEAQLISNEQDLSDQDKNYLNSAFSLVTAVNKRSICQNVLKDTLDPKKYLTKADMENLVLEERHRELMFEGKRWYDLVRKSRRDGNTKYLSGQVLQKYTSNTSAIQDKLAKMDAIFWPYNIDELKVNKNLKQNPAFGSGESGNYDTTK